MNKVQKKLFFGGLNSDDEDRLLENGDYRYALNVRNSKSDKSSVGSIENVKGDTEIDFDLPIGVNKAIGAKYDKVNNRIIFFIWNSNSNHSIYEYNQSSGTVTLLIQNSILAFDRSYPILEHNIHIIDDLCYWTDKNNPPRKINIATAKAGGYTTINEQTISRIQYAPNYSPVTEFGSDNSVNYNKVRGKMFQFKYAFVYDDNEVSAFSPVSKIAIPTNQGLFDYTGYYEPSLDNYIGVTLNTGNYLCKRIKIIARDSNNTDWVVVKDLDKDELNISDDSTHTFNFFNDDVYIPITQAEANRLFDNVPLVSGAQALIDGNRLVDSNITEGYDNIEVNATVTPVYNIAPPAITSSIVIGNTTNDLVSNPASQNTSVDFTELMSGTQTRTSDHYQFVKIIANTVNETDVWNIKCFVEATAGAAPYYVLEAAFDEFTATFPTGTDSLTIATYFMDAINNSTSLQFAAQPIASSPYAAFYGDAIADIALTTATYSILRIYYKAQVTFNSSGTADASAKYKTSVSITSNVVKKTFKHNAKYSAAIVYYDSPNRSGVCQVSDFMDVQVLPYSGLLNKGHVEMDVKIFHTAPLWASYYQILFTENRTTSKYLQIDTSGFVSLGDKYKIYINSIPTYNTQSGDRASLSYDFAKGDRVTIITNDTGVFFSEYLDFEILGSDTDIGGQYILIPNTTTLNLIVNDLIEIYTPKLDQDQTFYWEVGEVYPITAGLHGGNTQAQTSTLPAIVRVNSGDAYYRYRGYNVGYYVEDASLSDWYTSDSWDKGRFNIVDKDYKQIKRYATSYYSESYVPDTNINGLSTVYDTNFHEANKSYGAIQVAYAEQDRLIFFQQLRTGFSLVNKNIIYNSDGTPNGVIGQQNTVLSDVNYYAQNYGIGDNPESFWSEGTRKYHVDAQKGMVLRLSMDGYTPISDYKYRNFFRNKFNDRKNIINANLGKIYGTYDIAFDEYVLCFAPCQKPDNIQYTSKGVVINPGEIIIEGDTVAYSEFKNKWVTHYSYVPDFIISNGIDMIRWEDGKMYLMNSNSTYNNFAGVKYASQVETIVNEDFSNIKFFKNIYQESTDVWSVSITNPYGQESELDTTDFELNEGVYYAAFLKDKNTPNVSLPLIEGDDLRCHSLSISLTNSSAEFVKLFAVNVGYGFSEFTNR